MVTATAAQPPDVVHVQPVHVVPAHAGQQQREYCTQVLWQPLQFPLFFLI